VSPEHVLGPVDRSVVKFRREVLTHELGEIGKAFYLRAWALADGAGEMAGVLYVLGCELCPSGLIGQDAERLAEWWRKHYRDHGVEVNRRGRRNRHHDQDGSADGTLAEPGAPDQGGRA
jgi:hypothetical protein